MFFVPLKMNFMPFNIRPFYREDQAQFGLWIELVCAYKYLIIVDEITVVKRIF